MTEFYPEDAYDKQRDFLDRVEKVRENLRRDVVEYYRDAYPETADKAHDNLEEIYKFTKYAYQDLDKLLADLEAYF